MTAERRAVAVSRRRATDAHAPLFHFIAPEGPAVPFDPNGAIWWKGRYHLFYIFQDPDLPHGGHCWGHASSADLLQWTYHPTALAPAPGDPDTGIFSGGAFIDKTGVPTIIYHGVGAGTCLARALDDELIEWEKYPENPVIPETREGAEGFGVYNVFDPHCWLEGDTYYAILGGKVKPHDLRDTAYLFTSQDLISWRYERPFYHPHPHWTGEEEDCACPDFFYLPGSTAGSVNPDQGRHCLVCISHPRGARYYLGDWRDGTFIPESHTRMNWPGGGCFAPETLLDGDGRRIFWAWAIEARPWFLDGKQALGVMTMPRVLSLGDDGQLRIAPPVELRQLRQGADLVTESSDGPGESGDQSGTQVGSPRERHEELELTGQRQELSLAGDALEILVEADRLCRVELDVRRTPDGAETTSIILDPQAGSVSIDTTQSSLDADVWRSDPIVMADDRVDVPVQVAPLSVCDGDPLRLHVFVDRSIIEVFVNERVCMTGRAYPSRADATGVAIRGEGTVRIQGWQLGVAAGLPAM
ncbi:MAG: glycoside hydrolase family 32 protein [Gemmatimonadetes bacterium]|jgi:beta-fructofuranosidase|nr:glycoside hydrolase family 32 protein [Gemmatimonadota bacterium]MBT6145912.1 glycoside hydrolase family 32 protein [Gemmatimonadota bacterium]MBT7862164.1 glycoside hydrolase family 32 protein [Gemmatimonadota bacterium]